MASPSDFFYHAATAKTYQQCFGNPENNPETLEPEGKLTTAVQAGRLTATGEPTILAREYAVDAKGEHEGAYRLNVGTEGAPEYVYCTGRGVVEGGGASCRQNPCGVTTGDFVCFSAVVSDGDLCYHTCYSA